MIRCVIFDLDGTLVDSCAICVDILSGMLAERGSDRVIDADVARSLMSLGGQQMITVLLGSDCGDPALELAEFRERYQALTTPPESLYPGVADSLLRLYNAGLSLAICSNKPQNLCEQVLRDTGISNLFDFVVGSRDGLRSKPAPDLLIETLTGLNAASHECLFVGDSDLDYKIARNCGMPFAFMTYGYAADGWLPDEADCFDCFSTMAGTLLNRARLENAA